MKILMGPSQRTRVVEILLFCVESGAAFGLIQVCHCPLRLELNSDYLKASECDPFRIECACYNRLTP